MTFLTKLPRLNTFFQEINDPLYRNAGFIFGITVINSATGFLFWLLAARLYSPDEVGVSSSIISVVALLSGIAGMGLGIGIARFLGTSENPGSLINTSFSLTTLASFIICLIYLLGINIWSPSLAQVNDSQYYFSFGIFLFILFTSLGNLIQWIFIGLRKAGFAFAQSLIMNSFRLVFLFLLSSFTWGIALSVVIGWFISLLISLLFFLPRIIKVEIWPLLSKSSTVILVPFSIGNYFADFLYLAPALIAPPLMLEKFGASASAFTLP